MYPWFEPSTAPLSTDDLTVLLERPGVLDQVRSTGVRYVVWVDGSTDRVASGGGITCAAGVGGAGCMGLAWWEDDSRYDFDGMGHQGRRVRRHDPCRRQGPLRHAGHHHPDPADHSAAGARVPRAHGPAASVPDGARRLSGVAGTGGRSRHRLAERPRAPLAAAESADSVAVRRRVRRLDWPLHWASPASRQAGTHERPPRLGARSRIGNAADRHRDHGRGARPRAIARDRALALRERLPPAVPLVDHGRPATTRSRPRGATPQRRARGSAAPHPRRRETGRLRACSTFIRS